MVISFYNISSYIISSYIGCILAAAPIIYFAVSRVTKRRGEAVLDMALHQSIESIGVLVDSLGDGDGRYERQCREALIRLLPRLRGADAHLLDEYRQAKLRYFVRPPASPIYSTYLTRLTRNAAQNVALRIAIIEALSRVGDGEALTMFDELLDCRAYTLNERRIQQVVRDARPALQSRVAAEPSRRSLLRPSSAIEPAALLRLPQNGREMQTDLLLHVHE